MNAPPRIFDRRLRRLRRGHERTSRERFLRAEIEARLLERLDDIRREFPRVLALGCQDGTLAHGLRHRPGVERVVAMDEVGPGVDVMADEEMLPFARDSLDLVVSAMSLHWVNDLPGLLWQIRECLVPDGLLLAAFPGGETLAELRYALTQAELELAGGTGPRVSPFVDVRDAGDLLQRAGFNLPVADIERIDVAYHEPLKLLHDLRAMGESQALAEGAARPLRRDVLIRAFEIYGDQFLDDERRYRATFEIVFMAGWKPAPDQPRPKRRGSAEASLARALGVPVEVVQGRWREDGSQDGGA